MKSFLPPNCLKGGMCLLHLQKEGHNAYREAAFAAPPREEGASNNQGHAQALHRCQGAKVAPCKAKDEPGVCHMCDEPIPRKRDTIALKPVSCDSCHHQLLAEQPTTFGVPSWLDFLGMVHGFVKAAP